MKSEPDRTKSSAEQLSMSLQLSAFRSKQCKLSVEAEKKKLPSDLAPSPPLQSAPFFLMRNPGKLVQVHLKSKFQASEVLWLTGSPSAFLFGSSAFAIFMF